MRYTIALIGALLAAAAPATAQNFISNGGFENGTYTAGSNSGIPVKWTPNAACTTSNYCGAGIYSASPHTGSYALIIGDFDDAPLVTLSQSFSDVVGGLYTANFYSYATSNGDPAAYLTVSAGAKSLTFLDNINSYTLGTFTFTGTGSDTVTIAARTNPGFWLIDDVSVTGPALTTPPVAGAVPEPASWAMMIGGFGAVGVSLRRRGKQAARPITVPSIA